MEFKADADAMYVQITEQATALLSRKALPFPV